MDRTQKRFNRLTEIVEMKMKLSVYIIKSKSRTSIVQNIHTQTIRIQRRVIVLVVEMIIQ